MSVGSTIASLMPWTPWLGADIDLPAVFLVVQVFGVGDGGDLHDASKVPVQVQVVARGVLGPWSHGEHYLGIRPAGAPPPVVVVVADRLGEAEPAAQLVDGTFFPVVTGEDDPDSALGRGE